MFRYELHMHTVEGSACAVDTIHDMLRAYKRAGYAGVAVTNHFVGGNTAVDRRLPWEALVKAYARAYEEGKATAAALDMDLLFGVEEAYAPGKEFLAYGFEPALLIAHPELRKAGVARWAEVVHSVGGFIAYAHPFRRRWYVPDGRSMPDMSLVDGAEVFNTGNDPEDNREAARAFAGTDKILIAGSDTHIREFRRSCGIDLPRRVSSSAGLAAALHAGAFTLWLGPEDAPV